MPTRDARPDDVPAIAAMVHEHAAHEGAADQCRFDVASADAALFGTAPVLRALVAYLDPAPAQPVGCALWFPTFSTWAARSGIWLEDLYVRPEHRGTGLGRELLTALRGRTSGRIEWDVMRDNADAAAFYRRIGAAAVPEWVRYRWT